MGIAPASDGCHGRSLRLTRRACKKGGRLGLEPCFNGQSHHRSNQACGRSYSSLQKCDPRSTASSSKRRRVFSDSVDDMPPEAIASGREAPFFALQSHALARLASPVRSWPIRLALRWVSAPFVPASVSPASASPRLAARPGPAWPARRSSALQLT